MQQMINHLQQKKKKKQLKKFYTQHEFPYPPVSVYIFCIPENLENRCHEKDFKA